MKTANHLRITFALSSGLLRNERDIDRGEELRIAAWLLSSLRKEPTLCRVRARLFAALATRAGLDLRRAEESIAAVAYRYREVSKSLSDLTRMRIFFLSTLEETAGAFSHSLLMDRAPVIERRRALESLETKILDCTKTLEDLAIQYETRTAEHIQLGTQAERALRLLETCVTIHGFVARECDEAESRGQ